MRSLIVKFGAIGDVIMAIPAAHALHLAGHAVDWVVGPAALPILGMYPWINPIVADEAAILRGGAPARLKALLALWPALVRHQYELAATLYYDPRYRLLTLPVRAQRKVLLSHTDRDLRLLPGRHHTDEFARILLARPDTLNPTPLAPVPVPPASLPACPLPSTARTRVVLAPAGARNLMNDDALRRWPAESYVELARLLLAEGYEVVLIGGPTDTWVQPLFADLAVIDLIAALSLPETVALLDGSPLLVTHDTGPLHLAGVTCTSIIGLFGPTDPRGRLPQRPGTLALWGGESFPCRPCYDGHSFAACPRNACIREITPTRVLAEVLTMLRDREAGLLNAPRIASGGSSNPSASLVTLP